MSIYLKIKSKHLSVEAKIIRFEERKTSGEVRLSLANHRREVVGVENRATFLARAYIAGKPYLSVESSRRPEKENEFWNRVVPRVLTMVQKYHDKTLTLKSLSQWMGSCL